MNEDPKEFVIQVLPHRCPYCDQIISYGEIELKMGENPIECPSCRKTFIRIVSDSLLEGEGE